MKMLLKRIFILLLVGAMLLLPLISCDNADEKESGEPSESIGSENSTEKETDKENN